MEKEKEKEKGGWTLVERRKQRRPWEDLPSLALLNIFRRTDFKDRLETIPLVCKSWKSLLYEDPHCWSSMIPDSVSPEDAFIKNGGIYLPYELKFHPKHFQTLIERSGGGSAITSLYLKPFFSIHEFFDDDKYKSYDSREFELYETQILGLIAHSCPNLKHISFDGCDFRYSDFGEIKEEILKIFGRCKRLELIDFSNSRQIYSLAVIQEMGNQLPSLRGIRIRNPPVYYKIADWVATYLPRLKLLNAVGTLKYTTVSSGLSTILSNCLDLQYLNVAEFYSTSMSYPYGGCLEQQLIDQAYSQVPEFYWFNSSLFGGSCRSWSSSSTDSGYGDRRDENDPCYDGNEKRDENKCYESSDDHNYLFKDERSNAFYRTRAKGWRRKQIKVLYGSKREFKPLTDSKMLYANDSYVMPVCR